MSGGGSAQGGDADLKPARKKKTRRIIKSVLHNFLGTYTSRYSDFNGYWLFGFLVGDISQVAVDLLGADRYQEKNRAGFNRGGALQRFVYSFYPYPYPHYAYRSPIAYAEWLAARRFAEQIGKAGLPPSWFREARLEITMPADTRIGVVVRRHKCPGFEMRFFVQVITDLGRTYQDVRSIFVAPHDPGEERRRGSWWLP
jgi:hypothetical protein